MSSLNRKGEKISKRKRASQARICGSFVLVQTPRKAGDFLNEKKTFKTLMGKGTQKGWFPREPVQQIRKTFLKKKGVEGLLAAGNSI